MKKLNFNMGIASIHEVTTQMIGMQLSGANILALAVSATSVVAGTVSIAVMFYPGAYLLWIIAGLIGAGLAVLIEGLTLGALIRIRLANKKIRTVQTKLEAARDEQLSKIEQPTPQADHKAYRALVKTYKAAIKLAESDHRRKYRNATAEVRRARSWSCCIAFFGASASACAGGMFYHTLLASLDTFASLGISALFGLAVTVTFISSELFKDEQEQAIREGFKGGSLAEAAIKQETTRMTYRGVYNESVSFMQTDEARKMITDGFKDVLLQVMGEMKKLEGGQEVPALQRVTVVEEPPTDTTNDMTENRQETANGYANNTTDNATPNRQETANNDDREAAKNPPTDTTEDTTNDPPTDTPRGTSKKRQGSRQSTTTTGKIVAYRRRHPEASQSDIARVLNVSLRTVQRYDNRAEESEKTSAPLRVIQ